MLQQIGRTIAVVGILLACVGGILYLLGRAGLGRVPGDVSFGGRNWRVYLPLGTSLLLSALLTALMYLFHRLRR